MRIIMLSTATAIAALPYYAGKLLEPSLGPIRCLLRGAVMAAAFTPDGIWTITAIGFAVMVPVLLLLRRYDERLLSKESVWSKPFKFSLSLAIHFATLPARDR